MSVTEFRKIQQFGCERTFFVGLPKQFVTELGLEKGGYVRIGKQGNKLVLEPAE